MLIWDLANPSAPTSYSPVSSNSRPAENAEISCVAWNKSVGHIIATSLVSGRCVVWDLRNKKALLNFGDGSGRYRYSSIAWHPDAVRFPCLEG